MSKPQLLTIQGYDLFEVISALQKEIRRCNVDEALYWGVELHASGYANYAWKRMLIMSIEDVGMANPALATNINALHDISKKLESKTDKRHQDRLPFIQAIVMLAESKKSRYVDWVLNVKFDEHFSPEYWKPVPNYALDIHTRRGKVMGKTIKDFFTEGSQMNQHEPYKNEEDLKELCNSRWQMEDFDEKFPKPQQNVRKVKEVQEDDDPEPQPTLF